MKTLNPDNPIRNALQHLALGVAAAAFFTSGPSASAAPPVTTGLTLHLDASQLTGLSDNDPVATWADMSGLGNNATQTTAGDQPKYIASGAGGKPVVRFNGGSTKMNLADLSSSFPSAASVFAVITPSNDKMYSAFGNRNNDERWMGGNWSEVTPGAFKGGRANFSSSYSLMPTSGSHVFAYESGSSAYKFLLNGNLIGTAAGDYNSGSGRGWTIGTNGSGNGAELSGDIAELILYNRVLTAEESDQVGAYLATKYGLTTIYGPPTVVNYTPPDEGTTAVTSDLVLTFNQSIAFGTGNITIKDLATPANDRVIPVDSLPLDGSIVSISGAVLTINPGTDLLAGQGYAVQIDATAIKDLAGQPFAGISDNTTWNFTAEEPIPTSVTVVSSATPSTYGDSVTFTAKVAPIPSGGTVQFVSDGNNIGTSVTVNTTTGEATVATSMLGVVGPNVITAAYSGNYQFAGSTSASVSQVVNKAGLTVTAQRVFRFPNTANPDPLPYQINGFKNGQTLPTSGVSGEPILACAALPSDPVGDYPITCDVTTLPGMSADNYSFTPVGGILTVVDPAAPLAINVNFTGGTAETESALSGPAGGLGTTWNQFVGPNSPGTLLDAAGPPTTVTIATNFDLSAFDPTVIDLPILRGSSTNFGKGVDNTNVTISGLEAGGLYDIWLVTFRNQGNWNNGTEQYVGWWSTTNTTTSPVSQLVDARGESNNTSTFVNGYNYVLFQNVAANGSGQIAFTGVAGSLLVGSDNNSRLGLNGLQIQEASGSSYGTWAAANAPGQTPGQDNDNDGVENGIEYFMGQTGSSFTAMPGLNGNNEISWPMAAGYAGTYEVQTSPDLVTWTNVTPRPTPAIGYLTYRLTGLGKQFVRLLVVPTP